MIEWENYKRLENRRQMIRARSIIIVTRSVMNQLSNMDLSSVNDTLIIKQFLTNKFKTNIRSIYPHFDCGILLQLLFTKRGVSRRPFFTYSRTSWIAARSPTGKSLHPLGFQLRYFWCKIYSNGATQFTDWDPLRNASDEMVF